MFKTNAHHLVDTITTYKDLRASAQQNSVVNYYTKRLNEQNELGNLE